MSSMASANMVRYTCSLSMKIIVPLLEAALAPRGARMVTMSVALPSISVDSTRWAGSRVMAPGARIKACNSSGDTCS